MPSAMVCRLAAAVFSIAVGTSAAKKPNLIIFQPDEMRADSLGCYDNPISKTPNFDAFAKQGTRFDQTHVSYTVCSQSRAAFMTGWPTHVGGHRSLWALLHEWEPNLLKYFKQEGYTVKWWGKNDLLAPDAFNTSVTTAMSKGGQHFGANPYKTPEEPGYYSFLREAYAGNYTDTSDYQNVKAAIDFLNTQPNDEPFVIFLPLTMPHPPYGAPEPWHSSIHPDALPPLRKRGLPGKPDYHALMRQYLNLGEWPEENFRKLHAVYLGTVSFSDFLFGLLMEALEQSPFRDSTTVAVFSDHGDYTGDYGLVEKWPSGLEDVLTRVPLIVRTPGGVAGHVVKEPVQLFDIVPTVLEIANISLEHVQFGRSLVKQLHGEAGDPNRAVFAEGGYSSLEPRDVEGHPSQGPFAKDKKSDYYWKVRLEQDHWESVMRAASVRTMTHKLVLRSDPEIGYDDHCSELYDLQADPQELNNVYDNASYADVKAKLTDRLLKWFMHTSDVTRWQVDPRGGGMPYPHHKDTYESVRSANPSDFMQYAADIPQPGPFHYQV